MTQKIFLLKNKFFSLFFLILIFIIILSYYTLKKYDYNYFLDLIEKRLNVKIIEKGSYELDLFPSINLKQKNLKLSRNENEIKLISYKTDIEIIKEYLSFYKTKFYIETPSVSINNINLRNVVVKGSNEKSTTKIEKFFSNVNEGELSFYGDFFNDNKIKIDMNGNFKNLSLTRLLNQLNKISWNRIEIKLRSNFQMYTEGSNNRELIENLYANIPVKGIFYINTSQEERFGIALLNVLSEKMPEIRDISKSINFLISKYADIPSDIEGVIKIEKGILNTNNLLITSDDAKIKVDMSYNIANNNIDGKLLFIDNEEMILSTQLKGSIENPEILVGNVVLGTSEEEKNMQDLKFIIEKGITNIFQKLLEKNN